MRHAGAVTQPPPLVIPSTRKTIGKIARWTLYISGALAVAFGALVWPGNVREVGNVHGLAGWFVVASLWTLAAVAARSGVARSSVWLAVGSGLVTALTASAQHQLAPGTWITALHVAAGVGSIVLGQRLLARMPRAIRAKSKGECAQIAIKDAAAEFLARKRIAVTGVSRHPTQHGSNVVYRRLRERGYEVFAINPTATEVEGDRCYPDLKSIPGGVDAVVIATRADRAMATMSECAELGIEHVWMHRSVGAGSVSEDAAAWGRQRGMHVIAGGCPLMFDPAADAGHKMMRSLLTLTGKVPRRVMPPVRTREDL